MSHPLRIDYPNAWHYVRNRGRRGQDLFVDKADYQQFFNKKIDKKDTERIEIPAKSVLNIEHEDKGNTEDVKFQFKWEQ